MFFQLFSLKFSLQIPIPFRQIPQNFFREILTESDFYNENLKFKKSKFLAFFMFFQLFSLKFSPFPSSNSNTISANTPISARLA